MTRSVHDERRETMLHCRRLWRTSREALGVISRRADALSLFMNFFVAAVLASLLSFTRYKVHAPMWGLGFQKLARQAGVVCHVKFPDHSTDGYNDIWDFIVKELTKP